MSLRFERRPGWTKVYDTETGQKVAEIRRVWEVTDERPRHAGSVIVLEREKRRAEQQVRWWWRR